MSKQPWICPRCAVVNAPHIDQCTCKPFAPTAPSDTWQVRPTTIWWGDPPDAAPPPLTANVPCDVTIRDYIIINPLP